MNYTWDFSFLWASYPLYLVGLWKAAELCFLSLFFGMCIGVIFGSSRASKSAILRFVSSCYVEFFRNIPPIVQLFWWYYTIPVLFRVQGDAFLTACLALSLYLGAFFSEIYRSGIQSIEKGQWEASKALGLSYIAQLRYVIFPQALQRTFPALTVQVIEALKLTSIASSVAFPEILYSAKLISAVEYRPLEAYTIAAVVYIGISMLASYGLSRLERLQRKAG